MAQATKKRCICLFLIFPFFLIYFFYLPLSYSQAINPTNKQVDKSEFIDENSDSNLQRRIVITNLPWKDGKEVGDTTIYINTDLTLWAAYYQNGKYKNEIYVNWFWCSLSSSGVQEIIPLGSGTNIQFQRARQDSGFIFASSLFSIQGDSTGTIWIIRRDVREIVIRTEANNEGEPVEDVALTTDEKIQLFAAGYDLLGNYLGDQVVGWSSKGLIPPLDSESKSVIFSPTEPATGKIYAFKTISPININGNHEIGDSTGVFTVYPGVPFGEFSLTPNPASIPADGNAVSQITSSSIKDSEGNIVKTGTFITVKTDLGKIISIDENLLVPGIQVSTNQVGVISFELQAGTQWGTAAVEAVSVEGKAKGVTSVRLIGEILKLISTHSDRTTITQGQQNISVSCEVQNIGGSISFVQDVSLILIKPDSQIVTGEYQITRIDTITQIPAGQKRDFSFLVNATQNADTALVAIDGNIITQMGDYSDFEQKHQWQVQSPPVLGIPFISPAEDEVMPGREGIIITMQVENQGMTSVKNLKGELSFWQNGQNVSTDYTVEALEQNPTIIEGHDRVELKFSVDVCLTATTGSIVINGKISGLDVNTDQLYEKQGADLPASWIVISSSTEVQITSTKIICPNVNEYGDGEVNINQEYFVQVVVQNIGDEDLENIAISLTSDGCSIFNSDSAQVIESLLQAATDTTNFELIADAVNLPTVENFEARIDSGFGSITGEEVTISPAIDCSANVQITNPANLELIADKYYLEIPVGQNFKIRAKVINSPEIADFDTSGKLNILFSSQYELLSEPRIQSFVENEFVFWTLKAPDYPTGLDSILVYVYQKPRDKNNPEEFVLVKNEIIVIEVRAQETVLAISDVSITEPDSAVDGILSSEQNFKITGKIVKQKVEDVFVQIILPHEYSLDDAIKNIGVDSVVSWSVNAPINPHYDAERIIIEAWGTKENDTTKVYAIPDSSLLVQTVKKANLKVSAEIISPPSAIPQGQIAPGMEFQIKGEIVNYGDAQIYGDQSLELIIDPDDLSSFTVYENLIMPVTDDSVVWTILVSENIDTQIKILEVKIFQTPLDGNTNETAFIDENNKTAKIAVSTATGVGRLELMVKKIPEIEPLAIAPGEAIILMGIEFTNLANESSFEIEIDTLKFDVENKNNQLIDPTQIMSGFRVLNNESAILGQAINSLQNPIEIPLNYPVNIIPQQSEKLYMEIDFHENLNQQFKINLKDSSYIHAASLMDVFIVDEFRNSNISLNLRSSCPVISGKSLKQTFYNYPNPFGTSEQNLTYFVYYLSQAADVKIHIYTLIGELVWRCSYSKNQKQGEKGLYQGNEVTWDATNLKGYKVLNGVYIARIFTSYGESAIAKVAVIK